MLLDKTNMQNLVNSFNDKYKNLGIKFDLNAYESRAEALRPTTGYEGYNVAFRESFMEMYKSIVNAKINGLATLNNSSSRLFQDFSTLMNSYIDDCKKESSGISFLKPNGGLTSAEIAVISREVLDKAPTNAMKSASQKFKSGELTVDSALDFMRSKQDDMKEADAANLVSYANAIEERTSGRSWGQVLGNLFTHIKEKLAIRSLRKAASRCGNLEDLNKMALKENNSVIEERYFVNKHLEDSGASLEAQRNQIKEKLNLSEAFDKKPTKLSDRVLDSIDIEKVKYTNL